jgi:hypothetical protein
MPPRLELVYSRQAEAPFAVNKISTQAYHDIILPRAWDSKMDLNYPSERDFMLDQFRTRFDEVAGNIAGAMEQLAIVAEQEQNRKTGQPAWLNNFLPGTDDEENHLAVVTF